LRQEYGQSREAGSAAKFQFKTLVGIMRHDHKLTTERFAKMKRGFSRIRGFFIFGGFVFLLTLFTNGMRTASRTGHFFTTMDEIPRRLPFSIIAGVIVGLLYAFFGKRNNDV
jgi:hypothetical protein